ncbi:FAD-dependent oxidoreductase [Actinomadura sp. GTD37]|uniref:FAD-dependent oxidoreductase n=1 Tax=Actinomadura sp. GTD37 TaxID=1778030 RepID=UPI0035C0ED67
MTEPVDALVVGGGPAGAAAAAALARRGLRTLLADDPRPGTLHDVLVSGPARHALETLGGWDDARTRPAGELDLWFGARTRRVIDDAGMAVCDRAGLVASLRGAAEEAGAVLLAGRVADVCRTDGGHRATLADGTTVTARHVVLATGPGPARERAADAGTRLQCAQRFTGAAPGGRIVLQMVTPAGNDPKAQPSCVWALPGSGGFTICVTGGGPDAQALMDQAVAGLAEADPRFAGARPDGPLSAGPVDSGFAPEHAVDDGRLVAGDAAGLVNPFTGEGLSYAVQSGLLAAESIAGHPDDPEAAARSYGRALTRAFVGYFETARHAARRYHLAWRVLAATAESDHPFFAKGRRAVLLPEGIAGVTAAEPLDPGPRESLVLRPFLAGCDEVSVASVRREWPFIARMLITGGGPVHRSLRPAVLLCAGLMSAGAFPDIGRATTGSAIELASLGGLAFLGPAAPARPGGRGVDWGSATTVLAGDFLLAQACALVAEHAPELSWSFSDWLAELTVLRARYLDAAPGTSATDVFAAMFEYPLRAGALLADAPAEAVGPLREFGRHCGRSFVHAEDVLALRGLRTRLDTSLAAMLDGRVSALPELLGTPDLTAARLAADARLHGEALAAAAAACREELELARKAAAEVAEEMPARILRGFAEAMAAPALDAPVPGLPAPAGTRP